LEGGKKREEGGEDKESECVGNEQRNVKVSGGDISYQQHQVLNGERELHAQVTGTINGMLLK